MRRSPPVRHPLLTLLAVWALLTGCGVALLGSYANARAASRPALFAAR